MTHYQIARLLFRYQRDELTPDEQLQLDRWLDEAPANRERFNNCYNNPVWMRTELTKFRNIDVEAGRRRVYRMIRKRRMIRIACYAGVIAIVIAIVIFFLSRL